MRRIVHRSLAAILLFVSISGAPAVLRRLTTDANARPALAAMMLPAPPRTQLTRWLLSPRLRTDSIVPPLVLPAAARVDDRWIDADAGPLGLINLSQQLGNAPGLETSSVVRGAGWGIAYAALRLVSRRPQVRRFYFSYSGGIGVYVDGRRVFVGQNDDGSHYPGYLGIVEPEVDGIDVPLRKGATDIVLAITDKGFGSGFRARLDSREGIRIVVPSSSPGIADRY